MKIRGFKYVFSFVAAALSVFGEAAALDGVWRGDLDLGQAKLPLVFNFSEQGGETLCKLDSPMQGAKGIAAVVTHCSGDSVAVEIRSIGATYRGRVTSDAIRGTFSQRGYSFPLELTPEKPLSERRPQTPRAPFPYQSLDTVFTSADGVKLAGTLVLPDNWTKGVAVVMVSGSGPQNRDEEMFDHRPFAVIADRLAREGIASLRYDDRGTAQSEGDFKSADIDDFKSDAEAAVKFMRSVGRAGRVGVVGHSEGGTIALMLAADRSADFVVSLAGLAVKGRDMLIAQNSRVLDKLNPSEKQKDDMLKLLSLCFGDIAAGKAYADIDPDKYVAEYDLDVMPVVLASIKQNVAATSDGSYFRKLVSLDPSEWLPKIRCEVFAVNGSLDTQVDSRSNLAAIRDKVKKARVKEYEGLNHLLQHAATGEMNEYGDIAETISEEVLTDIVAFIKSVK